MKYVKILGLLAVAAAAIMTLAGPASATITSPASTVYSGPIEFSAGQFALDGAIDVACGGSTYKGTVGEGATKVSLSSVTFTGCNKDTWTVSEGGSLDISSNGWVVSTGMKLTTQLHRSVLGFPITTHCVYQTNVTHLGTLTQGTSAKLDIDSAVIPQVSTDGACGETAEWTGSYTVTTPSSLYVD